MRFEVHRDLGALARHAVEVVEAAAPRVVALSGGRSPVETYRLIGELGTLREAAVFFVDERCVPPDHEASNYKLVRDRVGEEVTGIVRVLGEEEPERAADAYELAVRDALGERPVIDLMVLGMGPDGHTASLFPGSPELEESARLAVATRDAHDGFRRVTLTFPVINSARQRLFIVTGEDKRDAVVRVARGEDLPAARVADALWLLDSAAAAGIQTA
jgi:6-phosphogluconolactonase